MDGFRNSHLGHKNTIQYKILVVLTMVVKDHGGDGKRNAGR